MRGNDAIVVEKMGLFLRIVPFLEYGSPSWTSLELLWVFQTIPEPAPGTEKGHTLIGYGLESLAPRAEHSAKLFHLFFRVSDEPVKEKPSENGVQISENSPLI